MIDSKDPLDADLLRTFLAVLEQGRIAAAARVENLSQPAVSARIRRLEESLGTALFERSVRGVSPTPAGLRLVGHAREVQRILRVAATDVGGAGELGVLTLAASTTIASYVLPRVLAAYRRQHPSVELELFIGNTEEVIDEVRQRRSALGLVEGRDKAQAVSLEPWIQDELQLVVGRDAPSQWRPQSFDDLEGIPILWREVGSGTRTVVARALHRAGARNKPSRGDLVLSSNEAIICGVASGLGVGFASKWSLGPHITSGQLRVVSNLEPQIRRRFNWAIPGGGLSATEAHFRRFADDNPPALT